MWSWNLQIYLGHADELYQLRCGKVLDGDGRHFVERLPLLPCGEVCIEYRKRTVSKLSRWYLPRHHRLKRFNFMHELWYGTIFYRWRIKLYQLQRGDFNFKHGELRMHALPGGLGVCHRGALCRFLMSCWHLLQ